MTNYIIKPLLNYILSINSNYLEEKGKEINDQEDNDKSVKVLK